MKKLLFYNFKGELNLQYFSELNLDIVFLNEKKGWNFAFKIQKILIKNKYDIVFHRGLAGGKENILGNIYLIRNAYLSDGEKIFDTQKYRFIDKFDYEKRNIITKLKVGISNPYLEEFSDIYDLESFWIASLTNFFSFPILTFKGVSDYNEFLSLEEEIEYLISEKSRINFYIEKYKDIIDSLSKKFSNILKNF